jgi:CRISPR type III-B/RAMP module-associated protein Cmr3
MNTLLLHPSDVLFFKDGRPMSGSHAGHGAAWPLPTVASAAIHAALHRADLEAITRQKLHQHRRGRSGKYSDEERHRDRKFGSLLTAGPFPVRIEGGTRSWFFPRPLDAAIFDSIIASYLPMSGDFCSSSLPSPLQYAVANTTEPSKDPLKPWWNEAAWNAYLETPKASDSTGQPEFKFDSDFSDAEHTIGIGVDAATGTQDGERFYSANYLRLREGWRIGMIAEANDKLDAEPERTRDLIADLFPNHGADTPIMVGGQQRLCSVRRHGETIVPLPMGNTDGFAVSKGKARVKWVLLTPAIFPQIGSHTGGWLPSWIDSVSGQVRLLDGPGANAARRHNQRTPGKPIGARLVAAMVGKPVPVTGYAIDNGLEDRAPGPKPTHLAVPAGSVYYFQADSETDARNLASALNWHGTTNGTKIKNRRSTLMGEKGFGIGVCGTWTGLTRPPAHVTNGMVV